MEKMTITAKLDMIENNGVDGISAEDFAFLLERARKSVRPTGKRSDKPTKAQIERQADLDAVTAFVAEKGTVTCADVEGHFGISNQKAARLLRDAVGVVKATEGKGKTKATYTVA